MIPVIEDQHNILHRAFELCEEILEKSAFFTFLKEVQKKLATLDTLCFYSPQFPHKVSLTEKSSPAPSTFFPVTLTLQLNSFTTPYWTK